MKPKDMVGLISGQNPRDILRAVSMVLDAEDISTPERESFISGYFAGLMYALYADPEEVEREILLRGQESGGEG